MVVAIGGLPMRPLTVTGERQNFGGHIGLRWSDVTIAVEEADESELGVGSPRLGMASLLGMSNSWSDGLFPVFPTAMRTAVCWRSGCSSGMRSAAC